MKEKKKRVKIRIVPFLIVVLIVILLIGLTYLLTLIPIKNIYSEPIGPIVIFRQPASPFGIIWYCVSRGNSNKKTFLPKETGLC